VEQQWCVDCGRARARPGGGLARAPRVGANSNAARRVVAWVRPAMMQRWVVAMRWPVVAFLIASAEAAKVKKPPLGFSSWNHFRTLLQLATDLSTVDRVAG
jgi:hypothetical protein